MCWVIQELVLPVLETLQYHHIWKTFLSGIFQASKIGSSQSLVCELLLPATSSSFYLTLFEPGWGFRKTWDSEIHYYWVRIDKSCHYYSICGWWRQIRLNQTVSLWSSVKFISNWKSCFNIDDFSIFSICFCQIAPKKRENIWFEDIWLQYFDSDFFCIHSAWMWQISGCKGGK